jgi:hypothetical protein
MIEVSGSGAPRRTIFRGNVQHNTDRIARTTMNVVICRTFMRSVLLWVIDPQRMVPTATLNTARLSTAWK